MAVLVKSDIENLAATKNLLGSYRQENIKGASYDLRAGAVFFKESGKSRTISALNKDKCHETYIVVLPSQIVSILTYEEVFLPDNICGTVFPINGLSSKGFLVLNPGHIDPGYHGPISLCAINLSKHEIPIHLMDPIFTIVFEKLTKKTIPYDSHFTTREEYEKEFLKNKAIKLSESFFDLITDYRYVPYLRSQLRKLRYQTLWKLIIRGIGILAAIATILTFIYKFQEQRKLIKGYETQIETMKSKPPKH